MLMYSLPFGFLAWGLALAAIAVRGRQGLLSYASFAAAALSALFPLLDVQRRAAGGDFAGIGDTARALLLGTAAMWAVTLVLNGAALWRKERNEV